MAEYLGRQVQLTEEKWKDRVLGNQNEGASEAAMFSGVGQRTLCIAPQLQDWMTEELRKESAILKERRKAREERNLLKPPKKE